MADRNDPSRASNFNSSANLTSNAGFPSTLSISSKDVDAEKKYNPFEHRQIEHPNSTLGSIIHLLKACIGSGILAMPAAFKNAGLVAGTIGTLLAGFVCLHTVHIFVKTSQEACIESRRPLMGYAETCAAAFEFGPKRLRKWASTIKILADVAMCITYISVLCVYVVFIGDSIKEVIDVYMPDYQISIQTYCAATLIPLALLSQIRNLKYLVPVSVLANLLLVVVFSVTLYFIFTDVPKIEDRVLVANVSTWPLFLSTVIFAMEGIGVVMPVENEMRKPQQFLGCPGVLNVAMIIVTTLFAVFGFFGYVKYGDAVKGSITLNLPQDSWVAQSAKILMALVIFFSFALQLYVPMDTINRLIAKGSERYQNLITICVRTGLVILSVGIAVAFPNLELVISLVGALFFSTLGLLIPAVVDTVYHWEKDLGKYNYVLWKNALIGIISLVAAVSGSYVSIVGLIEFFGESIELDYVTDSL